MTQTQNKYDISKLEAYLRLKKDASNEELYSLCNALTTSQKGTVRKTKSRLLIQFENNNNNETNETNNINIPQIKIDSGMKITKEGLEPLIANAVMNDPTNIQILRLAVDFCKINESEEEIEDINLNKLIEALVNDDSKTGSD